MAALSTARAASFTASERVGWAWQARARSSLEAPNSTTIITAQDGVKHPRDKTLAANRAYERRAQRLSRLFFAEEGVQPIWSQDDVAVVFLPVDH